jgi:putative redox protein
LHITVRHDQGMRFTAQCGNHVVVTGAAEGDDEQRNGMWPGQLFIAALGACIGGYVTTFCKRHDLPYQGMRVELDYESSDSPSRVTAVKAVLDLPTPIPDKYERALIRAADQCYVTQSIERRMEVKVLLADDAKRPADLQ